MCEGVNDVDWLISSVWKLQQFGKFFELHFDSQVFLQALKSNGTSVDSMIRISLMKLVTYQNKTAAPFGGINLKC